MASSGKIFIECSYQEKEAAKKKGAKWDFNAKKWYIPPKLWNDIQRFNKWRPNGRIYLDCPYSDKDRAKRKGARWDRDVSKWYFVPSKTKRESDFQEWLGGGAKSDASPGKAHASSRDTPSKLKAKSPIPSETPQTKTKSNPNDSSVECKKKSVQKTPTTPAKVSLAALPRINTDMTVSELQRECRARDPSIKGISSKNKEWLVNHLGAGTVWISADGAGSVDSTKSPPNAKNASPKAQISLQEANQTEKSKSVEKDDTASKKRKVDQGPKETKTSAKSKGTNKKQKQENGCAEEGDVAYSLLRGLPRINASLTIADLNHELHCRDPSIKGTSNKNKQWFLDQLGIGSVQVSSVSAKALDLTAVPKISKALTVAQLSHELMDRNPSQSGLSGKSKAWFLEQLCVGSLWTTCSGNSTELKNSELRGDDGNPNGKKLDEAKV